jgi:hypothetical protein
VPNLASTAEIALRQTRAHVRRVGQGTTAPLRCAHKSATTGDIALHLTCANASNGEVCGVISVKQAVSLCTVMSLVILSTLGGQDLIAAHPFVSTQRTLL